MHIWTKRGIVGSLIVLNLAMGAQAQAPPKVQSTSDMDKTTSTQWTLSTDDTHLKMSVANNRIYIDALENPKQNWNWTPVASEVPLIKSIVINGKTQSPDWKYQNATVDRTTGTTVTLMFTSTAPNLELKSIWRARPGVGPVEHRMVIVNKTAGDVVFKGDDIEAANLNLVADNAAQFFPGDAAVFGYGENKPLSYQIIKVGPTHGLYLAYDYGCGQYASTRDAANPLRIKSRFWIGSKVATKIATGATYNLPGIMILTYKGDEDDAANHFRKWFWNHEITPSLRNNPKEPPIVTAYPPPYDGMVDYLIQEVNTKNLAAMGVGHLKTDAWYNRAGHTKSAELAAACHTSGLTMGLYWDGHVSEDALKTEFAKSHFDYYRMDHYQRGAPFNVNDYHSVQAFNAKVDKMIALGAPNWRFENCANGGNLRTLDLCRRMTFMTHSDDDRFITFFNHVYHWSYLICPIQLRNDYNIGGQGQRFGGGNDIAKVRGLLLGACYTGSPSWWSQTDIDRIKVVFKLYNDRQRAILRGADVYRILPPPAKNAKGQWFGLQYYNTFINKGSVLLWQNGGPASQVIKLKGLDRAATYALTFEDATGKNCSMTGAKLMDDGVEVPMGPNASEIIWMEQREKSAP